MFPHGSGQDFFYFLKFFNLIICFLILIYLFWWRSNQIKTIEFHLLANNKLIPNSACKEKFSFEVKVIPIYC